MSKEMEEVKGKFGMGVPSLFELRNYIRMYGYNLH